MTNRMTSDDLNVLALAKGTNKERYVFLWKDADEKALLRVFGRFASNSELSFTWYDAAVLSRKVKENHQQKGSLK